MILTIGNYLLIMSKNKDNSLNLFWKTLIKRFSFKLILSLIFIDLKLKFLLMMSWVNCIKIFGQQLWTTKTKNLLIFREKLETELEHMSINFGIKLFILMFKLTTLILQWMILLKRLKELKDHWEWLKQKMKMMMI